MNDSNQKFTILLVDDEELIREVTSIMIEDQGGEVLTAVDGLDGVEVFAENRDKIDIVFLDFSMPRMNGYEAYLEISKIKPEVGFIMSSGLQITPEVELLRKQGAVSFISKPFHEDDLMKTIQSVLNRKR